MKADSPKPGNQLVGHPLGNHHRQPGVDPQPAKVGNFGQFAGQAGPSSPSGSISGSPPLRITSWIERSAAIVSQGSCAPTRPWDGPSRGRESAAGSKTGNGRHTPQLLPSRFGPGTSAAVRARNGRRPRPADRAGSRAAAASFGRLGQDLQQQRVGRVAGSDAGQVRPRHQQRKAAGRRLGLGRQRGVEAQQPAKLGRAADRLGQDRLPVGTAIDAGAAD